MRTLLAASLLVPVLALAQAPPPPPQPAPAPTRPPFGPPRPQFGPAPARPPPTAPMPGAPTGVPPPDQRAPAGAGGKPSILRTTDAKCVPLQGRFMLSFNKADIVDVLEQASRWTCRNFVYTEDVTRGKITLLSKTPVTAEEAYAAFLAALNSNNISVYASGRYYKLIRTADSKKNPIPTYVDERSGTPANEQPITKVIRLRYVDPDQMRGIVGNFVSAQGSDVQAIPPDMLIITDIGLNIRRIEKLMGAIDRQGGGDLVRIVQIRYASAKDIADKINQIFQAQGRSGTKRTMIASGAAGRPSPPGAAPAAAPAGGGAVEVSVSKILPDERTNKLIVIADEKSFQRILELIEQLDVPTSTGEGGIHVVFLKNANAEDLAQTLSNLAQGQAKRTAAGAPAPQPVPAAMQPGAHGLAAPTPGAPAATAELFSGEVKITADKTQNALLIQASGSDFSALLRLIEKLDRPRRQVFVEAVIVEVNLRNELQFGVGAHTAIPYTYKGETGVLPVVSAPGRLNSTTIGSAQGLLSALSLGGFLTGFAGPVTAELKDFGIPSLGVLVQALQTNSDVNVLSTPHLVATDNEESEISVGQNVPFQAGFAPQGLSSLLSGASSTGAAAAIGTGGLSSLYAPIQRQNVELRLKIKPQINEGGAVRLTIDEQTEEIADKDPQLGPTTAKRSVKTMIVAKDQSTIVLGGLIQERNLRSVRKIPLLGSLPIIGWLFRDTNTTKQRTNLLLFLTPYIIRNEEDYRRIYEKKRKEQQQFVEQFYGRQAGFEIDVDFTRKSGPYARMRAGVAEESSKIENGGPGGLGERVTYPPGERPPTPGAPGAPEERPPPEAAPAEGEEGTPVDRLDVQPDVPPPGGSATPGEGAPAGAQPPAAQPPTAQPPAGAPATPPETGQRRPPLAPPQ